jgi:HicA-like toxin of HicAB toxin-antitoxin system
MPSYERNVREILKEHGCYLHRQGKGDHETWYSPISNRYFTVDGKIKSRHTANEVLKQAGIGKKFD